MRPASSSAQGNQPTFATSSPITTTACGNVTKDISSLLTVIDPDAGEVETFFEASAPNQGGMLSIADPPVGTGPVSATIVGSSATPAAGSVIYTPAPGFSGMESFTIGVDDGTGLQNFVVVNVTVIPGPALTFGAMPLVCASSATATIPFSGLANVGAGSATYNFTGGNQTFTVPTFVTSVQFDAQGAAGGTNNYASSHDPGEGGRITGNLNVTPGQMLNIVVGGTGGNGSLFGATGGFNGGGNSFFFIYASGGGGGGASDIRIGGTALANRVVVAGGGAGDGADAGLAFAGGNGGGLIGGAGAYNLGGGRATGGTQSGGGAGATYAGNPPGFPGTLGTGGNGSTNGASGGGGGGYYGGGGGVWTGGGGGSSYANPSLTSGIVHTQGVNTGAGVVNISYNIPGTYNIVWDPTASSAGFASASGPIPTTSAFTVNIPAGLNPTTATTYNGVLTINNGTCTSQAYPISVTVKPVPSVGLPGNQVVCNGDTTTDITFFNPPIVASSLVNNWVNDNASIGLSASGSGHIGSFTPINMTTEPVVANITVTPVADGCAGEPQTFQIINNPIPALLSTTTPSGICDSTVFFYVPASSTSGASFSWIRATIPGIANPANAGTGTISEVLDNTTTDPIDVVYAETITANGCSSTANVTVKVNSKPTLTSTTAPAAICSGTMFNYTANTATTGAVLNWSRPAVAGNPASSGTGPISETLNNTGLSPINAVYTYSIDINGCTNTQNVIVVVNPKPALTTATTITPKCDSTTLTYLQGSTIPGTVFTWSRPAVAGITNPSGSGTGNIVEVLDNATALPIVVTYNDTLSAFGCKTGYSLPVTVYPSPKLTTSLSPMAICTNTLFTYIPASSTPGTTFEWGRDSVLGILNAATLGINNISEVLLSTSDNPVTIPYRYTLKANGCPYSQVVNLVVNPSPKLIVPAGLAVCDSQVFNFIPTSLTAGSSFSWFRPYVAGIAQVANSGTNNPGEVLINTTNINVDVTYVYTVTANGCSNTQNAVVAVRPSPKLSSIATRNVCTGVPFTYVPQSFTPGTEFTWSRGSVAGITPATGSGAGDITETLTSGSGAAVTAIYTYTLTISGCNSRQNVRVIVNPGPAVPVIASSSPNNVCGNTMFANFGAATPPPPGVTYSWSASNATVWATGSTRQYALINFTNPGTAVVTLSASSGQACISKTDFVVNVSGNTAASPEVIYFSGQFIAKQADVDSYQWGYDDRSTLDSVKITGETSQNFAESAPDFSNKNYWVITSRGGCIQKTYYRMPAGVSELDNAAGITVYPNPAQNIVNVTVNAAVAGDITVDVYNLLGQKISSVPANDHKAQVDVTNLPAGCYLIDCISDGVKIATARFIKN